MSRNSQSRFSIAPTVQHPRSTFSRNQKIVTSGSIGSFIPFFVDEILPGDTFQVDTNAVIRMTPMVSCPLDDLTMDIYWFYVPNRIVYDDWIRFQGEADTNAWTTPPTYKVPTISPPSGGWNNGTIADYLGIPTKVDCGPVNALPFRGVSMIYDRFFRDENVQDHVNIPTDAVNRTGSNGSSYVTDLALGGAVPKVNKLHDAFTSCLPNTQKAANPATVGMPVITGAPHLDPPGYNAFTPMTMVTGYGGTINGTAGKPLITGIGDGTMTTHSMNAEQLRTGFDMSGSYSFGSLAEPTTLVAPSNLYSTVSIPALRTAFQVQRFLEVIARTGTRYNEYIKAVYDVTVPDYRCQQPEYLGGQRFSINVQQITNMTAPSSASDDPLGTVGAYSLTNHSGSGWTKSFSEAGFIYGIMCCRYAHTYQQSLAKMWTRGNDRTDYFMPVFANISEQPIMKKEVACLGLPSDNDVFGYQEAWYDYRYLPDRVSAMCRTNSNSGLDIWHFADYYTASPTLSDTWMAEDPTNVDRALAVSDQTAGFQFFADILVNNKATRLLPLYSVPGLIDHN